MVLNKFFHNPRTVIATLLMIAMPALTKAQEVYAVEGNSTTVQLRTNGLYWLALSPNIGAELQTDLGIAVLMDYTGAWWNNNNKHRYWSNYAFQVEGRYYLESKEHSAPYKGHHVGLYGIMATYDFEFGGKGYQSSDLYKTFSVGASYGFSMPLTRKLSLDFTAGLGYVQSHYDVYVPMNGRYVRTNKKCLRYFGPSKLEVSLVWNINKENNKKHAL